MSWLSDYDQRTAWKYEPIRDMFPTRAELTRKVCPDGTFAPFPGSTAVFRADRTCRRIIQLMQGILCRELEETGMLASRLPADSIHMTLHDLVSPGGPASGAGEAYRRSTADSILSAVQTAEGIRKDFSGRSISMVSDRIVSMVSESLVLLLRPQTESDAELLAEMYARFERIRPLPYPLTPHITLAYFRPGMLNGDALGAAVDAAQVHPGDAPVFAFATEALTAQSFLDMQTYMDIPVRICFCCDGGMNRSVMAAAVTSCLADRRGIPLVAEARAAYPNTRGRTVPDQVLKTLENHGMAGAMQRSVRYLDQGEESQFTCFAGITAGALDRFHWLGIPEGKQEEAGHFFYGVRDPEYGEVTHEQAFCELYERAGKYLDVLEIRYRMHMK